MKKGINNLISGILFPVPAEAEFRVLSFICSRHHCRDVTANPPGPGEQPFPPEEE